MRESEALARLMLAARAQAGLSQQQLAARLGWSPAAIAALESGQHRVDGDLRNHLVQMLYSLGAPETQDLVSPYPAAGAPAMPAT
jgi:transcriptional regulator with XRE-family HTH domain